MSLDPEFSGAREPQGATLQVAARRGAVVSGGHLKIERDARQALLAQVQEALDDLEEREPREYWPDANLQPGQYFKVSRHEVDDSLGVLALLDAGADSDFLAPTDLERLRLLFYSTIVAVPGGGQVAFVAKSNPSMSLDKGAWFTPHGDSFANVTTPLFLFENRTDLVVGPEHILVLNQLAFEQWFRESPAIGEHLDKWVQEIDAHLPIAGDGVERLRKRAQTDSRIRRLLRNINERDHLRTVPMSRIRHHLAEQGLSDAGLVEDDKLVLPENPFILLKVLNEDLFLGGLTDLPFVSDNKEPRRSR